MNNQFYRRLLSLFFVFTFIINSCSESTNNGKSLVTLNKQNLYGYSLSISHVNPGDSVNITCWRNSSKGIGALVIADGKSFYMEEVKHDESKKDWERISISLRVPAYARSKGLKTYVYYKLGDEVSFDDLNVEVIPGEKIDDNNSSSLPSLNVQLDEENLEKIRQMRLGALSSGNVPKSSKRFVKASLEIDGETYPGSVRLKGDLLDHVETDKLSFRVLLDSGFTYKGLREFQVHKSICRDHINEWVFHELMEKEGVMHTGYSFIQMSINGADKGVYALEPSFTNELFEIKGMDPEPIVRINENGLWNNSSKGLNKYGNLSYVSAEVKGFKSQRGLKKKSFKKAKELLYDYKMNKKSADEVFNVDLMGRYVAIIDLCKAYHSLNWTNVRFYLDENEKLCPIGFDAYNQNGFMGIGTPFLGYHEDGKCSIEKDGDYCFREALFNSPGFVEKYYFYLDQYAQDDFIDAALSEMNAEIRVFEAAINKQDDKYFYDFNWLKKNAKEIRTYLYPMNELSVKVYRKKKGLKILSYASTPIQINSGKSKIVLKPYQLKKKAKPYFIPNDGRKELIFTVPGIDKEFKEKVIR